MELEPLAQFMKGTLRFPMRMGVSRAFAVIVVRFGRTVFRFSGFEKGLIGRDKDFK
jgi:hypothetical protein